MGLCWDGHSPKRFARLELTLSCDLRQVSLICINVTYVRVYDKAFSTAAVRRREARSR